MSHFFSSRTTADFSGMAIIHLAEHAAFVLMGDSVSPVKIRRHLPDQSATVHAALYFLIFVSWARANDIECFYFEAFDESLKANYEGPQGAHWGTWDKDGNLKSGVQNVFDNQSSEVHRTLIWYRNL